MYKRLLIANRGEIARRIIRTARRMGIATMAIHSHADSNAAHVEEADEAVQISAPAPAQAYLQGEAIIAAAMANGVDAIHPGYGFLSENAAFAEAVIAAGITWIGPSPDTIRLLGDKSAAREKMAALGFPVSLGGPVSGTEQALSLGRKIGVPIMLKAAAGGGGIGMHIVHDLDKLPADVERVSAQALRFFGNGSLLVERFFARARHIELQVVGTADGLVHVLGERDCSVQRRFQKVVEETPPPGISQALRARMHDAAKRALSAIGYRNLGTVECLVDGEEFIFLEVNTRLQVEHPITEMVTGIDLVEAQLRIAAGETPGFDPGAVQSRGHAIELRVYTEDPVRFLPGGGEIVAWHEPVGPGIRVDAGYRPGDTVSPYSDPLMAKLCVWGEDRAQVLERARDAVDAFTIIGPKNNLPFLARVLRDPYFAAGTYDTAIVQRLQAVTA